MPEPPNPDPMITTPKCSSVVMSNGRRLSSTDRCEGGQGDIQPIGAPYRRRATFRQHLARAAALIQGTRQGRERDSHQSLASRKVATLMCGQLSPLKLRSTVWLYCSCWKLGDACAVSSQKVDVTSAAFALGPAVPPTRNAVLAVPPP